MTYYRVRASNKISVWNFSLTSLDYLARGFMRNLVFQHYAGSIIENTVISIHPPDIWPVHPKDTEKKLNIGVRIIDGGIKA